MASTYLRRIPTSLLWPNSDPPTCTPYVRQWALWYPREEARFDFSRFGPGPGRLISSTRLPAPSVETLTSVWAGFGAIGELRPLAQGSHCSSMGGVLCLFFDPLAPSDQIYFGKIRVRYQKGKRSAEHPDNVNGRQQIGWRLGGALASSWLLEPETVRIFALHNPLNALYFTPTCSMARRGQKSD